MVVRNLVKVVLAVAGLAAQSGIARADAIDGEWCFGSETISIRGPRIRTPGGAELDGQYGRHDFRYVVPSGEPGAGGTVDMRLMGDELMLVRRPSGPADENWRRCKPIS